HAARSRTVRGQWLLHENIEALLDRIRVMNPAERERRRENGDVALLQRVHRFLEGVEADELRIVRYIDVGACFAFDRVKAGVHAVLENIRHGGELDGAFLDAKSVGGGAGAATAAAHQSDA